MLSTDVALMRIQSMIGTSPIGSPIRTSTRHVVDVDSGEGFPPLCGGGIPLVRNRAVRFITLVTSLHMSVYALWKRTWSHSTLTRCGLRKDRPVGLWSVTAACTHVSKAPRTVGRRGIGRCLKLWDGNPILHKELMYPALVRTPPWWREAFCPRVAMCKPDVNHCVL